MPVRNFDTTEERQTCASCRYSYPTIRRFCPMCGVPVAENKDLPVSGDPAAERGPGVKERTGSALQAIFTAVLRKPITLAVTTLLLVGALYQLAVRGRSIEKTTAPSIEATASEPRTEKALVPVNASDKPPAAVEEVSAAKPQPEITSKPVDDDPTQLWSQVRHGNTGAEVALAKMYLQGTTLERSCEQAHVLLVAASRKQSKEADSILAGTYAQQCQ